MQLPSYLRRISGTAGGVLALAIAAAPMGAQSLPPTPPTVLPSQATTASPAVATPAPNLPHHAEVSYSDGQVQIRADNSSLNQILRSISHMTGLKITGGVEEQRVFGNYGPAPLSTILATLLDGTGANILLLGGNPGTPPELVLTSRSGLAELPGPNSPTYAMYDDSVDRSTPVQPPSARSMPPPVSGAALPAQNQPLTPPPGKPLTPEIVAQELLQMQAQQDQKKKELDEKIRQEQLDQAGKHSTVPPQPQPNQPPASPANPQ
jgi:hypothetical protein